MPVHEMGNTKSYASRILRFLNRGLREEGDDKLRFFDSSFLVFQETRELMVER